MFMRMMMMISMYVWDMACIGGGIAWKGSGA